MPIDRTVFNASIDDSGTGTDGTIEDKAWFMAAILDPIDAALVAGGGNWQGVPFTAGDYAAAPPMVWTVAAGHLATNRYTLLGKTLIWTVSIQASTLSGTPSTRLAIRLPAGVTAAATMLGGSGYGYIGGTWQPIMLQVTTAQQTIDIFTANAGNFVIGSLYIQFTLTLEVQ